MTTLLTPKDVEGIRKQSAAIPHLIKAIIILAVFGALTGALSLYQATKLQTLTETNQKLARDVRECTTPSKPGDDHECYDRAQDDALRVRKSRDVQNAAIQAAADRAAAAAVAAQAAAEAVPNCFKPEGECTKSAARNQAFVEDQLGITVAAIKALEFHVTGTVGQPGQPGMPFTGTATTAPAPPAPAACIGVGNVGILPGALTCGGPR